MPDVLLTGATGLMGKSILECLLRKDLKVCCVGRRRPEVNHDNCRYIQGDFSGDPESILSNLPKFDTVVHAAACVICDDPSLEFELYQKVNISFTEALFRYCKRRNVSKVIYISGFCFLQKPLAPLIDENHTVAPLTACAISKYWGELALFKNSNNAYKPFAIRVSSPLPLKYEHLHDTVIKKWIKLQTIINSSCEHRDN